MSTQTAEIPPPWEDTEESIPSEKIPLIDQIASEFVGFWNRLVSQTNWEKGRVIHSWRTKLVEAQLPRTIYSDEALAQRIGNVSSQHVGRLRRVFERFGDSETYRNADRFTGLYWSHYQAALDWDDADEWLAKGADEGLSVAMMRITRWERYGAPADKKPKPEEIVDAEPDEDVHPLNDSSGSDDVVEWSPRNPFDGETDARRESDSPLSPPSDESNEARREKKSRADDEPSFDYSADPEIRAELERIRVADEGWNSLERSTGEILKEFSGLERLPNDLAAPLDELKAALVRHKVTGWSEVSREVILHRLAALRAIVLAKDE